MNTLSSYIKVYDDIFSKKECNTILKEYIESSGWNSSESEDNYNFQSLSIPKDSTVDDLIFSKVSDVLQKYTNDFPNCNLKTDNGYHLMKYDTKGYYRQHTDNFYEFPNKAFASFFLNDDYDGGNFCFFNKKHKIEQKLGSVVVFPSNFMFPHEITKITKGTRYSLVTWFN